MEVLSKHCYNKTNSYSEQNRMVRILQSIMEDIKNQDFKQVYLLYGAENYLRRQYRDKLRNALMDPEDTMNFHYFEGKTVAFGQIIDLAETLPFFSERRVIVIENSGVFKQGGEQLAEYLKTPASTAYFILNEEEIDKRSRLLKVTKEIGRTVEFSRQEVPVLKKWIRGLIQQEEKSIEEAAVSLFLEKTGDNMDNIRSELEKLICYCGSSRQISVVDVEEICTARTSNRIFDMINAIADKKQKRALQLYYDLLELREPPMRILFLIARQFNLLMQVKELKSKGMDSRTIAGKTGLHSFVVSKYQDQAAKFSMESLRHALEACVEAEEAVKMGKMADRLSVEVLIIQYTLS